MLRQIHIYHNGERIYNYSYAKAFGDEELNNVQKTIQSYIDMPIPGKTFQRPASNFQLFHRTIGNFVFLFITDLVDHIDYIEKIIEKTIEKYKELFPNQEDIRETDISQSNFTKFLEGIQHELHSKITIVGPTNSGKTLLYDMLKGNGEKPIMNFAKSSNYLIDNLNFDIWDFQLKDNFSLLWSKFISGADLIILLFDLSNYHLRVINHFLDLRNQESKLSKIVILGNKRDLVSDDDIRLIKNELNLEEFEEISLLEPDAKDKVNLIISNVLGLKKALPSNFNDLIKEAERLVSDGNLVLAISKYKELISMCNIYQELTHIQIFKKKLQTIQEKIDQQTKLRKAEESKRRFELPGRIQFTKRVQVKPLPVDKTKIETKPPADVAELKKKGIKPKTPVKKTEDLTLFKPAGKKKMPEKTYLQAKDIKVEKDFTVFHAKRPELEEKESEKDFPKELQILIEKKGSSLSLKLCEQLITELQKTLSRPLTVDDIEMAAEIFVKQESI